MTGFSRGGALIETALTMGVVLIVLLATVQLSIVGFKQTAQDGAVFVAARTYAQSPVSGVPRATTAATSVFDTIPSSSIVVAPSATFVTATAAGTASAPTVPGAPATISLKSGATERIAAAGTAGAFSATATLSNYRDASGTATATHPLIPAQPGLIAIGNCDQTGQNQGCTGNHQYSGPLYSGPTAEYDCRLAGFKSFTLPASRPHGAGTGPGSTWDPASTSSPLNAIYGWDGTHGCN